MEFRNWRWLLTINRILRVSSAKLIADTLEFNSCDYWISVALTVLYWKYSTYPHY